MGVWRDGTRGFRYDFRYQGQRYRSPRGFPTKGEASEAETELRRRLRRQAAGLDPLPSERTSPRIVEFAGMYLHHTQTRKQLRAIDSIRYELGMVLRFWGARPALDREPDAPYHDLRLQDAIADPDWLLKFEDWMRARGLSASRRNKYRTRMSQVYALAMSAAYRRMTGITVNPFRGTGLREPTHGRTVTLPFEDLRKILAHASPPLRMMIAIGALAPKLRLSNVAALEWKPSATGTAHVTPDFRQLIIHDHKTVERTGPMVAHVSAQLRQILERAHHARTGSRYVVGAAYNRWVMTSELKRACRAAGVTYGIKAGGITYHTIRHTAATLLAAQGVPEGLRKQVMGHLAIATTQKYTHLEPAHEAAPLEGLSAALPIVDLVIPPKDFPRGLPRGRNFRLVPKPRKHQ